MIAYHGKQEVKDIYVNRMQAHMDADELIRGTGFENGKGCAVGCTLNNYSHTQFESELGVPEEIARLLDSLHEGTSSEVWPTLSLRFLDAIKPGADLTKLPNHINLFILNRNKVRMADLKDLDGEVRRVVIAAIDQCIELHTSELAGVIVESAARSAARLAARSALESAESARSAARPAARSALESAWSAARSASMSASESAESAAMSASESALESAARPAELDLIAEELIRLLESA